MKNGLISQNIRIDRGYALAYEAYGLIKQFGITIYGAPKLYEVRSLAARFDVNGVTAYAPIE